jgi:hypothetical protein
MFYMLAMAVVALAAPAMAQGAMAGTGGVDILGDGIFETEGSAFRFPPEADTNIDILKVGNDNTLAVGWMFPRHKGPAVATNNLEIKKNQDSGECACCKVLDASAPCSDCCIKYNIEQIEVGNRKAMAFGFAAATNNVKIVTNQQ